MKYYPVFVNIAQRKCVVAGGGKVGARKARTLIDHGADVTIISPDFCDECYALPDSSGILIKKEYEKQDLNGAFFVFAATDSSPLNLRIKEDAKQAGVLCNMADAPDKSDFILPSIFRRGDLSLAVSTSGNSPALAKKIRVELEKTFGHEYTCLLNLMGNIRKKLLLSDHNPDDHREKFNLLLESELLNLIRQDNSPEIDRLFHEILGDGFFYNELKTAGTDKK